MRFPWPAASTAFAVAVLLALGTWQIDRLNWKRDLIAEIAARTAAEPVDLPARAIAAGNWNYRRVRLQGTFLHGHEFHLLATDRRGRFGYHVLTPLERKGGGLVLVDRGWVPDGKKDAATRAGGQIEGVVEVSGIARAPWRKSWIAPDNDIAANVWFEPDLDAMGAELGAELAPVVVEADGQANPGGLPRGGQTRLAIVNNHLAYAITWYVLALAAIVIFIIHRRQRTY